MDREVSTLRGNAPRQVYPSSVQRVGSIGSKPHSTSNASTTKDYRDATSEKISLPQFLSKYHHDFPIRVRVCKGFCGPDEELSISDGDQFNVHFLKYTTIIAIEYENGSRFNVPLNSAIPFAVLYNPHNNVNEAMKGYRFDKVSDVLQMATLPPILWARKAYQGSTSDSSISANELLIVRKVRNKLLGKQQLKVYSLTTGKDKVLSANCSGNFSTKPRDICLYLPEILKHLPDIFPNKAVLFNNQTDATPRVVGTHQRTGSNSKLGVATLVTMLHSSIETSLVATSVHDQDPENARLLDIPIDLDILVRVENSVDEDETQRLYEDTSFIYEHFNPANLCPYVKDQSDQHTQSQFYTNVCFGQERSGVDVSKPRLIDNVPSEGHYQHPRSIRKQSDPVPIESVYHPPEDTRVTPERRISREHSPAITPVDPSWRPPLPPPRVKTETSRSSKRSDGYCYVETHPRSTRPAMSQSAEQLPSNRRTAALGSAHSDPGAPLSCSAPVDTAGSDSSCGSTGSGSGIVEGRRGSASGRSFEKKGGSDSGIVEARARVAQLSNSAAVQRQTSTPVRPESLMLNNMLDDLNQMAKELDSCLESEDTSSSTDVSNSGSSCEGIAVSLTDKQSTPVSPEALERNKQALASMDNTEVLKLLEVMNLEQYIETFRLQHINGDILCDCDDDILTNELQVSSRLHRLRLLRIISGQYSVLDMMAGQEGYVLMSPANHK